MTSTTTRTISFTRTVYHIQNILWPGGFCHGICNIIIIIINLLFFLPPIPPTYLKIISSFLNLNLILNMYDMELTSIICRTKNSRSYRAICCAQFPVVLKNWSSSWVFSLTPPVNMKRSLSLKARIFSFVSFSEKKKMFTLTFWNQNLSWICKSLLLCQLYEYWMLCHSQEEHA